MEAPFFFAIPASLLPFPAVMQRPSKPSTWPFARYAAMNVSVVGTPSSPILISVTPESFS